MTTPFSIWKERVRSAKDEHDRRALLAEVGGWRAVRLTDIPAQREASWAISEIYRLLGDREKAAHEAQQLIALCRTAPKPPRELVAEAERHLGRLTRTERSKPRDGAWQSMVEAAHAGRWDQVRQGLGKSRNPKASLLRVWGRLAEALAEDEPKRSERLQALERDLAARFPVETERKAPASTPAAGAKTVSLDDAVAPAPASDGGAPRPLAILLDGPVPRRREPLLAAIDARLEADPTAVDALAAASLRDHVAQQGVKSVAPWLIGYAVRALGEGEAPLTREAIAELGDAYAVTAYREEPFAVLHALWASLRAAGLAPQRARRGLLRRGELDDRRGWTLRVLRAEREHLVAVFPEVSKAWPTDALERVVARLRELDPVAVVVAPGELHAPLREAAQAAGLLVAEGGDPGQVVGCIESAPPAPEPAPETETSPARPASKRSADDPSDTLRALFTAEPPVDEGAYAEPLSTLRRSYRAFVAVREPLHALPVAEVDVRFAPFLRAVHAITPPNVRLVEATSEAARIAAAVPDGAVAALLAGGDEVAARYGAPSILGFVEVLRALVSDGWSADRVLLGLTRGEERERPALGALGKAVTGISRVSVQRGEAQGELWWIDNPSAEAQMALPLLLATESPRVIAVREGQELPDVPGTSASWVTWSGAETEALREAAASWVATPPASEGAQEPTA